MVLSRSSQLSPHRGGLQSTLPAKIRRTRSPDRCSSHTTRYTNQEYTLLQSRSPPLAVFLLSIYISYRYRFTGEWPISACWDCSPSWSSLCMTLNILHLIDRHSRCEAAIAFEKSSVQKHAFYVSALIAFPIILPLDSAFLNKFSPCDSCKTSQLNIFVIWAHIRGFASQLVCPAGLTCVFSFKPKYLVSFAYTYLLPPSTAAWLIVQQPNSRNRGYRLTLDQGSQHPMYLIGISLALKSAVTRLCFSDASCQILCHNLNHIASLYNISILKYRT